MFANPPPQALRALLKDAKTIVDECIALKLPAVWLQEGVVNEPAAARALAAGMTLVMDRCISVEYRKLLA